MESSSSSYEHCEQQAQTTSSNSAMSKDISKWTVGELRSFLKGRGVPASGYVKSQLLDMVRRAQQSPQILEEIQENDNEEITSNGDVYTGGCQCIGDDGGCKHVVALLFAVAEYTEKKGQQSCTDVASTWDKPHSLGKSNCRLDSIDCRSDGTTPQAVKPYPCNFNPILEVNTGYTSSDMDADMLDVALSNDNAVMLGVLQGYTPPSPPPSIPDLWLGNLFCRWPY
ncbi:hypothetical protein Pmani_012694 [Petrolisthes manimaculis]|uniref:SWIM-type domain-containing protein n=1 Tax=Petrolisthes manimaculis TaxID=1843537 RepID=A0AAE1PWL6_9EUCA|nr:hypothetical protein Pmani_012694 [Petrolisthes manimaculis]